jgi:RNA polymerase sigma factor (sigma-70 family)
MIDGLQHNPKVSQNELAANHRAVYQWALSLSRYDAAAADDVMQQSYLAIVDGSARFDGSSSLKTWVFGVVRNMARRSRRIRRLQLVLLQRVGAEPREVATQMPDADGDAALAAAIAALPHRQREVLDLIVHAEFTLEETAAVLGISVGSARTHYHRAKVTLRGRLESNAFPDSKK